MAWKHRRLAPSSKINCDIQVERCRLTKVDPHARLRATVTHLHAGERDHARMTPAAYVEKTTTLT